MSNCDHCKEPVRNYGNLLETRDGRLICLRCQIVLNICEICGSTTMPGQSKDAQLHYEEECFK
jgi:hypothetical protein